MSNVIVKMDSKVLDDLVRKECIGFAVWTCENLWTCYSKTNEWFPYMNEDNPISGEQLYELYKQYKEKLNATIQSNIPS